MKDWDELFRAISEVERAGMLRRMDEASGRAKTAA